MKERVMEPVQNNQPADRGASFQKPSKDKKTLFILVAVLLVAGVGVGTWWYGSSQAKKEAGTRIQNLQSQIDDLKKIQAQEREAEPNKAQVSQIEKDAEEIGKALTARCNQNAQRLKKYTASNEEGQTVEKITPDFLSTYSLSSRKTYIPAKGWFAINIGCHSVDPVEEEGGGYVSVLQRQADESWKEVLGTQGVLSCATVDQYKIPQEIQDECDTADGQGTMRKNTN